MVWRKDDPQGNEAAKIIWETVPYTRGKVLDIGCGPHKAFPHFIGVDNEVDTKLFGIQMKPDIKVDDAASLPMFASEQFDAVFSSHLLEHIVDYKAALKEWWRLIKVGGYLCLYLPHKDFYPNIGVEGANPDHKHDFLPSDIMDAMDDKCFDLVRNEDRNDGTEYSFFQVYKKLAEGKFFSHKVPKPSKTCGIIRYGGWGDNLQMSSILPELKKQGYHITLYTTPRAWEVVKHDPHIDGVVLQDTNQVPNHNLPAFWENEKKKYTKFINLSESVEATWLVLQESSRALWPTKVRDKYFQANYIEFQHDLAEVPYTRPNMKFYASVAEQMWADKEKESMGGKPTILWSLTGSSVHKTWPHIDQIFARVMLTYPDARIVLVGDEKADVLVGPWAKEPRVISKVGKWSIRETLAFANIADLVVGPETGVMSSVSMQSMPKIVFLSHSSHENLTRDWANTFALWSTKTACYPCHKLHYSWKTCVQNQDKVDGKDAPWAGTAQCQVDLPPEACWEALVRALSPLVEAKKIKQKVFPIGQQKVVAMPPPKKKPEMLQGVFPAA